MDTPARLPAHLMVGAVIRRAQAAGSFATVVHRGDAERGDMMVKVLTPRGQVRLVGRVLGEQGQRVWDTLVAGDGRDGEIAVDARIEKARSWDSDLWVIEIEDREGRDFLSDVD